MREFSKAEMKVHSLAAAYIKSHQDVTLFLGPAVKVAEHGGSDSEIIDAFVETAIQHIGGKSVN